MKDQFTVKRNKTENRDDSRGDTASENSMSNAEDPESTWNNRDHHRDLIARNRDYDVTVVYRYDECREVASSANDSAIELDVCNEGNLEMSIRNEVHNRKENVIQ